MWLAYYNDPVITKNIRVKRVFRGMEEKSEMRLRAEEMCYVNVEENFFPRPKYSYCGTYFRNVGSLITENVCCYCSMIFMDS
jgi:hypothetical protein